MSRRGTRPAREREVRRAGKTVRLSHSRTLPQILTRELYNKPGKNKTPSHSRGRCFDELESYFRFWQNYRVAGTWFLFRISRCYPVNLEMGFHGAVFGFLPLFGSGNGIKS